MRAMLLFPIVYGLARSYNLAVHLHVRRGSVHIIYLEIDVEYVI
jgi:hypothetical protein